MKKFQHLDPAMIPDIFFALPELQYPPGFNAIRTLLEPLRSASPSNPAYVFGTDSISFGDVVRESQRYAVALKRLGVGKGNRVLLRVDDSPELIFSILAVQALGAVAIPTYSQLRAKDLIYRIEDSGASFAIVSEDLLDEVTLAQAEIGQLQELIVVGAGPESHTSLKQYLPLDSADFEYADTHRDDIALILYTSGSTSKPKGTCHSHSDLLAVCDTYARYSLQLSSTDVIISPAAIPFAAGYGYLLLYPLRFKATAVLINDKNPGTLIAAAQKFNATILMAVPTYFNRLTKYLDEKSAALPSIRISISGGEPLPRSVADAWSRTTGLKLRQVLGTTELLHIFLADAGGLECADGAIGHGVPGYEVSVRHPDTLMPLDRFETGLLCVRGATGTHYLNKPDAQASVVRTGWNVFPDVVYQDASGAIHYVSRDDEMIISGGHSISPVDVEQILLQHEAVLECACIAAPDPSGERPQIVQAFIVTRGGQEPSIELSQKIQQFFKHNGPPYMYPRAIQFVTTLPKTVNGKIMRSALREEFRLAQQASSDGAPCPKRVEVDRTEKEVAS